MVFEERLRAMREAIQAGRLYMTDHAAHAAVDRRIPQSMIETALLGAAEIIEDYPEYHNGPCCLVLSWIEGRPLHIVVSYPPNVIVVTAYRPDERAARWSEDFRRRVGR